MGTAPFGIPALEKLLQAGHTITGVVTAAPKPRGRGLTTQVSPIHEYAESLGLAPILTPLSLKSAEFEASLRQLSADIYVVVAFRILPENIFAIPQFGAVNIHASLLPRYRGAAPIQRAIEAGEHETGVTIFSIERGIDTGKIILQERLSIGPQETTPQLAERLSHLGAHALVEALEQLQKGLVEPMSQDESSASGAPKLKKSEGHIDWGLSAQVIFNRIRAFKPFPGTFTTLCGKSLSIEWAEPTTDRSALPPGTISSVSKDAFDVQCGEGTLRIREVKPEGKKNMHAGDFLRGARLTQGVRFE